MAETVAAEPNSIVLEAKDKYDVDKAHWDNFVYEAARDDLQFLSDQPGAQWDAGQYAARKETNRPALQIDYIKQYVNQAINTFRKQERVADVVALSTKFKPQANVLKGMLKKIQYDSTAEEAYATAVGSAIKCSIGFIKVDHCYKEEDSDSLEQKIVIKRKINPFAIYLDSNSTELNGSDAKHCTELEEISREEFEARWPDKAPISFTLAKRGADVRTTEQEKKITICHYEVINETRDKVKNEAGDIKREVVRRKVMRYILSGDDVLEEAESPFKFISTIPVYGEEAWEDGERHIHSLIRKSKESQKQYNLLQSVKTEILLMTVRASVLATPSAVDDYAKEWRDPAGRMVLHINDKDEDGNPIAPPTILPPPQVSSGMVEAAQSSVVDIRNTIGMQNEMMGQATNAESGVAINARKIQGDNQIYHYGDNAMHSIEQVCRVVLSGIPVIYDTARIEQIINDEEEPEFVYINYQLPVDPQQAAMVQQQMEAEQIKLVGDIKSGNYDVRVTVGESYATQRQEAQEFILSVVQSRPDLMNIIGDKLFEYSDLAGSEVLASRMKKMLPPQLLDDGGQDPQLAAMAAQLQQSQAIIQQLSQALQQAQTDKQAKLLETQRKAQNDAGRLQLDTAKLASQNALESRSLDLQQNKQSQEALVEATRLHMDDLAGRMERFERVTLPPAGGMALNQSGGENENG